MTSQERFKEQLDRLAEGALQQLRDLPPPEPAEARAEAAAPLVGPLHAAASVLSTFDQSTLKGAHVKGESQDDILEVLADSTPIRAETGVKWKLLMDVRRDTLRRLGSRDEISRALEANRNRPRDPVQSIFEAYVAGNAPSLETQSPAQLAATFEVAQWLDELDIPLGSPLPSLAEIRAQNDYVTLLKPFDDLAGSTFAGRESELAMLRDYVGVLKPGSKLTGIVREARKILNLLEKPPLMIHGPGGVGKSALISRFIWEHATVADSQKFPFVYLDFDRASIRSEEPLTLMTEAVRQFGLQYSEAREYSDRIRLEWQEELVYRYSQHAGGDAFAGPAEAAPSTDRGPSSEEDWIRYARAFGDLLGNVRGGKDPCLFVLDTFEEVQYQGDAVVTGLSEFLTELQREVPRLRIVVAGRVPLEVADFPVDAKELGDFDNKAANQFLASRGVDPADLRKTIIERIGKSPLSLLMAATVFSRARASGEEEAFELEDGRWEELTEARIQGELYRRILTHIQDPTVADLAYPGLALRRVTPDVIRRVLAGPCKVEVPDDQTAEDLFIRLAREVSLVHVESDALVHRRDVRRIMLPLVRDGEKDAVAEIEELAIAYYAGRADSVDRAEEIYHRLSRRQPLDVVAARWDKGAKPYLYNALDPSELQPKQRAWLARYLDVDHRLTPEEQEAADPETWEWDAERRTLELTKRNRLSAALECLQVRTSRTAGSRLYGLEADILEQQRKWSESLAVIDRAIEETQEPAHRAQRIDFLIRAAQLRIRLNDDATALSRLSEAESLLPKEPFDGPSALRIGLTRDVLRHSPASRADMSSIGESDSLDRLAAVSDAQLEASPDLAFWAARDLDATHAPLQRVIKILGLELRPGESRALGRAVAVWDDSVSRERRVWKGSLGGRDLPWSETLTQAWTGLIRSETPKDLGTRIARLLKDRDPPADVLGVLYEIVDDRAGEVGIFERETDMEETGHVRSTAVPTIDANATYGDASARLSPAQRGDLSEALLDAFGSRRQLSELVRFRLGRSLDSIVFSESLTVVVFQLIEFAIKQGWVASLVTAALESRPGNARLLKIAEQLGLATAVPSFKEIEEEVERRRGLLDPVAWRSKLGLLEPRVCRIEVSSGQGAYTVGTGFLFGPDLLLTAYNVAAPLIEGRVQPPDVQLRFDYKRLPDGITVNPGVLFPLANDAVVCSSPSAPPTPRAAAGVPEGSGLNYALLHVAGMPGNEPIGGDRAEPGAEIRGWIDVPDRPYDFLVRSHLFVLHHAAGGPLLVSLDLNGVIGLDETGTRVRYQASTAPGSSGAPCFDAGWELVALHEAGDGDISQGIPISLIVEDINRQGQGGALLYRTV